VRIARRRTALAETHWQPIFAPWRHDGWYVTNLCHPSGAVGCVSRNYADRKWRIVCDPRPDGHEHTYGSRVEAAFAERELSLAGEFDK